MRKVLTRALVALTLLLGVLGVLAGFDWTAKPRSAHLVPPPPPPAAARFITEAQAKVLGARPVGLTPQAAMAALAGAPAGANLSFTDKGTVIAAATTHCTRSKVNFINFYDAYYCGGDQWAVHYTWDGCRRIYDYPVGTVTNGLIYSVDNYTWYPWHVYSTQNNRNAYRCYDYEGGYTLWGPIYANSQGNMSGIWTYIAYVDRCPTTGAMCSDA